MTTTYQYVSPGVIDVTDANGATTRLTFTNTGQIAQIEDPLNRVTQFTYDANDYLSQLTAPGNTIYGFDYDAEGRLLSQTDPLGQTVSFAYGLNSDAPVTVTDQRGNVTTYSYDASGSLTGITYEGGSGETFTYNASGQLIQVVERSGDTFQYAYDGEGRLTLKTFDNGTFEQFTYDANGNLTTILDARGDTTTLAYDTENRLTQITYPTGRFLQFAYDTEGRRTQLVDQDGFTVNYRYDGEGRLEELTDASNARIVLYEYDGTGQLVQETNGNGTYTTYGYDPAGQLTSIINHAPDDSINSSFSYTYDDLGRQTQAIAPEGTWNYTYDLTGQLTRAQLTSADPTIADQDLQYVYDAAGNRISTTINGVTTNYSRNDLNQYLQVGTAEYIYDLDGNLTQIVDGAKITTFTYNDENRLIGVTTPDGDSWTYEYDALGNRVATIENGQRTDYLVDPFGLGDVVGEYGGGGLIVKYAHGLGLVSRFSGNNATYYDSNLIGSTVGLTNSSGEYINRYAYQPYGENLLTAENIANPFEYVGQWGVMNESNGLDFIRARFSNPIEGRFINSDPSGQNGGVNLYAYSYNAPTSFIDINGLEGIPATGPSSNGGGNNSQGNPNGRNQKPPSPPSPPPKKKSLLDPNPPEPGPGLGTGLEGLGQPGSIIACTVAIGGAGIALLATKNPQVATSAFIGIVALFAGSAQPASADEGSGDCDDRTPAEYPPDNAPNVYDPLILDLDGNGIELISIEQSGVLFDLNADGFKEQTGWVSPNDGMLALDANGNAQIDNITELFGDATTDGFDELRIIDSNSDNIINASDIQFSQLRIWQDLDQDGVTDAGELKTLDQLGIETISLNTTETFYEREGSLIRSTSQFSFTNGTQNEAASIWFSVDQINTIYDQPFQLKPETLFLPTVRGYGQLPDLYIAMSLDNQLLNLMRDFVQLDITDLDQAYSKIEKILLRWADVDEIESDSRGEFFDARKLGFMEKFLLQNLEFNFTSDFNTLFVRQAWETISRAIAGRLIVQGPMRSLFPDTVYNLNQDILETSVDLAIILASIQANVPSEINEAARYWSYAIAALDAHEDLFGLPQEEYDNQIKTVLASFGLSEYLEAIRNVVWGTNDNDRLLGNEFFRSEASIASFLDGLQGNDNLQGTAKNDIIFAGDGDDFIRRTQLSDSPGIDLIEGGDGYDTLADADFSDEVNDLSINSSGDPITLTDGTTIKGVEHYVNLSTGSGNDTISLASRLNSSISTGDGNDVINAGLGQSDIVDGSAGDDLLILNYSVGDTGKGLTFSASTGGGPTGASGIALRQEAGTNNTLDFLQFFGIDRFEVTGTRQGDTIRTWEGDDIINAGAGNDTIDGRGGNDTINAGAGDDEVTSSGGTLDGGAGIDELTVNLSQTEEDLAFTDLNEGIALAGLLQAINFEQFDIHTGSGNDTILRSGTANGVAVRFNDRLIAGAGDNVINAGLGQSDYAEGGAGDDLLILDYSVGDTGKGLTFSASTGGGPTGASGIALRQEADTNNTLDFLQFFGIDRFEVTGTRQGDTIRTWEGDDVINAGAGNDIIDGRGGNDIIDAGEGNDEVTSSGGTLDGGAGIDELTINLSQSDEDLAFTDLNEGIALAGLLQANNFEQFDIHTGSGNDTILRSGTANGVAVRFNDRLIAGAGDNVINAGLGQSDYAEGGAGDDLLILDYSVGDTGKGLTFSASTGGGPTGASGIALRQEADTNNTLDFLQFFGIDRFEVTGTRQGDTIRTWEGDDIIIAGAGNDTIDGRGGNDIIDAGEGDDEVTSSGGTLDGGDGIDELTINLSQSDEDLAFTDLNEGIALAGLLQANNFEQFDIRTGSGNDTILRSGTSNGVVVRFNDRLIAGAGDNVINAGLGQSDYAEGGAGDDLLILDYSVGDTGKGLTFSANFGGGPTGASGIALRQEADTNNTLDFLQFFGIDRFEVTGTRQGDTIRTWEGDDIIIAGAGNDTIDGRGGNDIIDAGEGDDEVTSSGGTLDGGDGIDELTINLSQSDEDLAFTDLNEGIALAGLLQANNFEQFDIRTGSGNDTILRSGTSNGVVVRFNDRLIAGAGDNVINAGLGQSDYAEGGAGNDLLILDYSVCDTGKGLTFSANFGGGPTGVSGIALRQEADTNNNLDFLQFVNIDRFEVTGTRQGDTIRTWEGDDIINAGAGNDIIDGRDGNDIIKAVSTTDANPGIGEQDTISGGVGSDTFILGTVDWVAYDDQNPTSAGEEDFALITDFNSAEDIIQLKGLASDYRLEISGNATHLYLQKPDAEPDELIAKLQNATGLDLASAAFDYVNDIPPALAVIAFDLANPHVLLGQAEITFTLENQSSSPLDAVDLQIAYSDDETFGDDDDQIVGNLTLTDLLVGEAMSDGLTVQLPVDLLNSRAQAEDTPGQGSSYVSQNVDYLGLVNSTGELLATRNITYFPWDIDGSGQVTPSDAIYVINRLGQTTTPENALADFDGSGQITPSDAIAAINRLGYAVNPTIFGDFSSS
jgi:RHS repeat-associated protein